MITLFIKIYIPYFDESKLNKGGKETRKKKISKLIANTNHNPLVNINRRHYIKLFSLPNNTKTLQKMSRFIFPHLYSYLLIFPITVFNNLKLK